MNGLYKMITPHDILVSVLMKHSQISLHGAAMLPMRRSLFNPLLATVSANEWNSGHHYGPAACHYNLGILRICKPTSKPNAPPARSATQSLLPKVAPSQMLARASRPAQPASVLSVGLLGRIRDQRSWPRSVGPSTSRLAPLCAPATISCTPGRWR